MQQVELLEGIYGAIGPEVVYTKDDDALDKAAAEAREQLQARRSQLEQAMAEGVYFTVKAPFETDDGGIEWMWVEVKSWEGSKLTGVLENEPLKIEALRPGAVVTVEQEELFDYMALHPDGTREGWISTRVLAEMEGHQLPE